MRLYRLGLPAAVAVLAIAAPAAPASAEPAPAVPLVGVLVPEQVTVIEGKTKAVTATVVNAGTAEAKAVVLTFGSAIHPVDPGVGLGLPAGCDAQGCVAGDLAPGASRRFTFTLTPTGPGTDLASTFDVTVGGAEGVLGYESPVTVVRAKSGVDLELAAIDDMKLGRGQTANVPVLVRNTGSEPVDGIGLVMVAESGLEGLTRYRNCVAETDADLSAVICVFDQKFPAGTTFTLPSGTPLQIKVAADAGGPYKYSAALIAVGITGEAALAAKSGPTLELEAARSARAVGDEPDAPEDINADDNIASFGVAVGTSGADSAAVGDSFGGAAGDEQTVQVGVRNLGPTGVVPPSLTWFQTVRVTIPGGVRLTEVDDDCVPGTDQALFDFEDAGTVDGDVYTCFVLTRLGKGAKHTFTFTGEITEGRHTAGKVVVDGGVQDSNAANDEATLDVRLTAGGEGGGLPVTGSPAAWVAVGGAVLLVIGLTAVRLARRRRIVTVAG